MINRAANICLVAFGTLVFVAAACETAQRDAAHKARTTYAEPRFPSCDYATDYAPNPWKTVKGVIDRVLAGNYDHFYPLTSGRSPSGPKATEY